MARARQAPLEAANIAFWLPRVHMVVNVCCAEKCVVWYGPRGMVRIACQHAGVVFGSGVTKDIGCLGYEGYWVPNLTPTVSPEHEPH